MRRMMLRLRLSFMRPEEKRRVCCIMMGTIGIQNKISSPLKHLSRTYLGLSAVKFYYLNYYYSCYYHHHKVWVVKILSFLYAHIVFGCALIYALHLPGEECFTKSFAHPSIHPFHNAQSESKRFLALVRDLSINKMHENTPRVTGVCMRVGIYTKLWAFHIFIFNMILFLSAFYFDSIALLLRLLFYFEEISVFGSKFVVIVCI